MCFRAHNPPSHRRPYTDDVLQIVDGHKVRLKAPHDFGFLAQWGTVFTVLDQQDSGNLCFGVEGSDGRLFVKYAGAETERATTTVAEARANLRRATEVYRDLAHPHLVALRFAGEVGTGFAHVFEWVEGVPLGRMYERRSEADGLGTRERSTALQQIYDFHVHAVERGWVAVDLYDASVLLDSSTGAVTLCDLDFYTRGPLVNTMGRMWGSTRFMSPEEFELGASIDERTNVFALGALAHTLLGDDDSKDPNSWIGSRAQLAVATTALSPSRADRWPTVAALANAWRSASASGAAH